MLVVKLLVLFEMFLFMSSCSVREHAAETRNGRGPVENQEVAKSKIAAPEVSICDDLELSLLRKLHCADWYDHNGLSQDRIHFEPNGTFIFYDAGDTIEPIELRGKYTVHEEEVNLSFDDKPANGQMVWKAKLISGALYIGVDSYFFGYPNNDA